MTTHTPEPFPVTYSILSTDSLADEVTDAYALQPPVRCELLRPGLNDTFLVTAAGDRSILRVYRAGWRSPEEVAWELDLLAHLATKGIAVSQPRPDRSGLLMRSLAAPEGMRQFVLFDYAPGAALSWDRGDDCRLLGRIAAEVHDAGEDFAPGHERFSLDLGYLIDAPLEAIGSFLDHRPDDRRDLREFGARIGRRVETAAETGLDWGVCHGDLSAQHVHVGPGGRATLFDFDLCGAGWRSYDLAAAPYYAVYKQRRASWEAFLDGYREVRELAHRDLAAVGLFHAVNRLWSLGLYARNAGRWGSLAVKDAYLDGNLAFFREWEREHPDDR
jgi:Ser/Thr protein kinase RdoA (MazF antagonist)